MKHDWYITMIYLKTYRHGFNDYGIGKKKFIQKKKQLNNYLRKNLLYKQTFG